MTKFPSDRFVWFIFPAVILIAAATAIFWPKPKADPQAEAIKQYQLPPQYTRADLEGMLARMGKTKEFEFYFQALDVQRRGKCAEEIFALLLARPDPRQLKQMLLDEQEKIFAQSTLFYYLDYTEEFVRNPAAFPELETAFWKFIEGEFKLAVLGVYYKANIDRDFIFLWDKTALLAAEKFQSLWSQRRAYLLNTR